MSIRRLCRATGGDGRRCRPAREAGAAGIGPRSGQFQPQLPLDPTHRLLVDRPALAIQQGPDPPVAEPRVGAGQLLDPSSQRRLFVARDGRVPEAGAGQVQRPGNAALRYVEFSRISATIRRRRAAVMAFFSTVRERAKTPAFPDNAAPGRPGVTAVSSWSEPSS